MRSFFSGLLIIGLPLAQNTGFADNPDVPADVARQADVLIEQGCAEAGVSPLASATDAEFLRRIWLDLGGRTPPLSLAKQAVEGALEREKVIDDVLRSPEAARHFGRVWTEYLTGRRPFDGDGYRAENLVHYFTESFAANVSYDRIIGDLLAGSGASDSTGPVNFLLRYNVEPAPLAGAVGQKFLGTSLHCAECHDHPHAHWKQQDFWGLAAYFARLRRMSPTEPQGDEDFSLVIERPQGELTVSDLQAPRNPDEDPPRRTVFPRLPGGPATAARNSRRAQLSAWLTDPHNPYVSRHVVNLTWERLLGARLVPNLDDWPPAEPTTETAVLNFLAQDFVAHQFDLQRLLKVIVLTRAYQRSAAGSASDAASPDAQNRREREYSHWARARIRPLSADQIHLSLAQAFGYHYDEDDFRLAQTTGDDFTYDLPVESFGAVPLSPRRSLALYNSDHLRGAVEFAAQATLRREGSVVGPEHIDRLFLALLTRTPSLDEQQQFLRLADEQDAQPGLEDVTWVLLNSAEFQTNH